jgi:sugar phosphate isomerase/epimerase
MTTRREFLQSSSTVLAAACARALDGGGAASRAPAGRLPLGFSTLGCPQWEWRQVLDFAADHGYAALELRGLQGEMDLTRRPEFAPERIAESRRQLADHGLRVVCLGSSANMHETDASKRAAQLDEARRFIDLAQALSAPYVRVFGNKYVAGEPRETTIARIAATLRELGEFARQRNVAVLLESHGDFTDSPTLLEILRRTDSPAVALLWDAHHTYAFANEPPEETVRQLGRYIRHTHLKDSVPAGKDRRYVLTGAGDVPVRRQIEALARSGYRGYYSFEWEKRWHSEIEEPEIAIPHFARVASGYLRGALNPSNRAARAPDDSASFG